MKKDYRIDDNVVIIKHGMFQGINGVVLSNNTDTQFKSLTIILSGTCGTWSFSYADVEPLGKDKLKVDHKIVEPNSENKIENLTVATKPEKRAYHKKVKDQPVKEKRKYSKRVKP